MLSDVLNLYLSSICMVIGILGNIFMLSILFRWLIKFHVNFNFGQGNNRIHRASAFNLKSRPRQGITINRHNVLNYAICIFLVFFSMSDIGYLVGTLIINILNKASNCIDSNIILLTDLVNAFKGSNEITSEMKLRFASKNLLLGSF